MKIIKVYREKLIYKGYAPNTIKSYEAALYNFLYLNKGVNPRLVTTKLIINYLEGKSYKSISQQNQYIGALKLFAKYILGKKDIHLKKIERPKNKKTLPRVIDQQELRAKILSISNIKHKAILALTFSCALRVSEVINMRISDIDSKRMVIHINNSKGSKDRVVNLSETILEILRKYYLEYLPNEYLFNGQNKLKYSYTSCSKIVKKYLGYNCTMHTLRHSGATAMLDNGTDIRVIQNTLGHSNIKTTQIYTHLNLKTIKSAKMAI